MTFILAQWSPRGVLKLWSAGLLVEAALLLVMFTLLVRPEPPLVEQLRGREHGPRQIVVIRPDRTSPGSGMPPSLASRPMPVREDSFYTVLHWPLHKPLLAGGGRVIAMPMRRWWVPALYVGAVPLCLLAVSVAWLLARTARGAPGDPRAV